MFLEPNISYQIEILFCSRSPMTYIIHQFFLQHTKIQLYFEELNGYDRILQDANILQYSKMLLLLPDLVC